MQRDQKMILNIALHQGNTAFKIEIIRIVIYY